MIMTKQANLNGGESKCNQQLAFRFTQIKKDSRSRAESFDEKEESAFKQRRKS